MSSETDETLRIRVDFPISSVAGAASTAVVYFELEPGEHTGMHTDSAEETVVVVSGVASLTVGDETEEVRAGGVALVPECVPHEVRNACDETLRFAAVYASTEVTTTYEDDVQPDGGRERDPIG